MSTLTQLRPFEDIVDLFFNELQNPYAKKYMTMNAKANDTELLLQFELPGYDKVK